MDVYIIHLNLCICICTWICPLFKFTAYCDHFRPPPDIFRVPLHQGHNGAIYRLIMAVRSTGRPARCQSRTASLMAHYSLLNDHTDDPNSVAGCPHSACLKQHFTLLAKVHCPWQLKTKRWIWGWGFVFVMLTQPCILSCFSSKNYHYNSSKLLYIFYVDVSWGCTDINVSLLIFYTENCGSMFSEISEIEHNNLKILSVIVK